MTIGESRIFMPGPDAGTQRGCSIETAISACRDAVNSPNDENYNYDQFSKLNDREDPEVILKLREMGVTDEEWSKWQRAFDQDAQNRDQRQKEELSNLVQEVRGAMEGWKKFETATRYSEEEAEAEDEAINLFKEVKNRIGVFSLKNPGSNLDELLEQLGTTFEEWETWIKKVSK